MKNYKEEEENTICLICGKKYLYLGSHIWHSHKIKAKEYKIRFGLNYNYSLMSKEVMDKKKKAYAKNRKKYLKNLNRKNCFVKGVNNRKYYSKQSEQENTARIEKLNESRIAELCPICKMKYDNFDSHLYMKHSLKRVK